MEDLVGDGQIMGITKRRAKLSPHATGVVLSGHQITIVRVRYVHCTFVIYVHYVSLTLTIHLCSGYMLSKAFVSEPE